MNLAAVMDQIGDALATIPGLRVFRWPVDKVTPPAAVVTYPDELTFDETYGRGSDRMVVPIVVTVGRVSTRAARDQLAGYANGSGQRSIKAAVDGATYTACDSVRVTSAEFDVFTIAGVDYIGATFDVDVVGSGT